MTIKCAAVEKTDKKKCKVKNLKPMKGAWKMFNLCQSKKHKPKRKIAERLSYETIAAEHQRYTEGYAGPHPKQNPT